MKIAILVLSIFQVVCLVAVHIVNPSMHFAREQLSLYTNGNWGIIVPATILCFAATLGLAAFNLRRNHAAKVRTIPLAMAAILYLLAGIFRVDGPEVSVTVHNTAAILGMVTLLLAMGVWGGRERIISLAFCLGGILLSAGGVFLPSMVGLFHKALLLGCIGWVNWITHAQKWKKSEAGPLHS
jgi:hypothetical protein